MTADLRPLHDLWDGTSGPELPLPDRLAALYGRLRIPHAAAQRPYFISNFVTSLDGVVALNEPGTGGDEISGESREDRFVMGLLRAVADVVIVGAGTLRAFPRHVWTPEAIYAPTKAAFAELRTRMGKIDPALTVMVSGSGDLDPALPVFTSPNAPAVVVTTDKGAKNLGPSWPTPVHVAGAGPTLEATAIVRALKLDANALVLLECGPKLFGRFLMDELVDELFLTLAPQIVGRDASVHRDGLVRDALFLPRHPRWTDLSSVKQCGSVLFLRYVRRAALGPAAG